MFKKLFKNKPIGFYFSLVASALSLFMMIFYAVYMSKHDFFNAGVFILYLLAVLSPVVYFFVKENALTRSVPIFQTTFLALAFGITVASVGRTIVYFIMKAQNLLDTSVSGNVLLFILIFTAVTLLISFVASFMKQTKKLTAAEQAEVDEDWSNFKSNTKEFAVKHKKPLIISGAGLVAIIVFLVILFSVIVPSALIVHVDTVKFTQSDVVMYETEKLQLETAIDPENAENKNLTFSSSNKNVATVTESGVVEALSEGETTITVTAEDGEFSDSCKVVVRELTVQSTTIQKMPNTVHYLYGEDEKFSASGISIVATLSNGKTEKISKSKHGLAYSAPAENTVDGDIVVSGTVPITATYNYRGKTFNTNFDVYADAAEIADAQAFTSSLANNNIGYMIFEDDISVDSLTLDRNLGIEGNISVEQLTVNDGVTLTMADGRITSGGAMTISGGGKIVATDYETASLPGQDRAEHAAIRASGELSIDGTDVECSNINAGSMTVKGGANVTVYGKLVNINRNTGFGDVKYWGVNGVHLNGTLNVSGEGTVLEVLYNDAEFGTVPAALESTGITVDGATLRVDSNDGCASWGYGIWGNNNAYIKAINGADVSFSIYENNTTGLTGLSRLEILDNSNFTINAVNCFSDNSLVVEVDDDASVKINGTAFDTTKPLDERVFGNLEFTEAVVSVDQSRKYYAGDTFSGEGITVSAKYGELSVILYSGYTVEKIRLVEGNNAVTVTVGNKEFTVNINASPALEEGTVSVKNATEFAAALDNANVDYISIDADFEVDSATITRNITVYGTLDIAMLTVNEGATLTMANGRIMSDDDITVSGGGKVVATAYSPATGKRPDFAAIYSAGDLTISGNTEIESKYIYTIGNFTVTDGAKVTVYGDASMAGTQGINGVHQDGEGGSVTVSNGAVLNILYSVETFNTGKPAALETYDINVDNATINVGSSENCADWGYAVWGKNNAIITIKNGATVTFDVGNELGLGGTNGIVVSDTSTFNMTAGDYFDSNMTAEFDSTATVTVDGVVFDNNKPINERVFGNMAFSSVNSATADNTKTYYAGNRVSAEDITVNATYGSISVTLDNGFTIEDKELVTGNNTVNVIVGDSSIACNVYAYPVQTESTVTVTDANLLTAALANDSVNEIYVSGNFTIDSATVTHSVTVYGDLNIANLTVNEGAMLTMADGRMAYDGVMAISGAGTVVIMNYAPENASTRSDYASVYSNGALTISGVTVNCNYIYTTGDITIEGGADVTVYAKNQYVANEGMSGVHAVKSTLTVNGADTELNVLYNDQDRDKSPAAFQVSHINVSGAIVNVGSSESCVSWGYAVWFEDEAVNNITLTDGAQMTINVDASSSNTHWGRIICSSDVNTISIRITEGTTVGETTSLVVNTSSSVGFNADMVAEGKELVQVNYPSSAE